MGLLIVGEFALREALQQVAKELEFFHRGISVELEIIHRQADADAMSNALKQFAAASDRDLHAGNA